MIVEPRFPLAFVDLVKTILHSELDVDKAKARIPLSSASQLFSLID